jgi:excisionase family DNA binding protein
LTSLIYHVSVINATVFGVHLSRYHEGVKGYMTLEEMAAALGLKNPSTLRMQIGRGVIAAERVGKRAWIVSDEEVERYRREHLGKRGNYDHKAARRKSAAPLSDS